MRLKFLNVLLHLRYRGPNVIPCDVPVAKGDEMGWFEHGSTIIVFMPAGVSLNTAIRLGDRVNMGQALMGFDSPAT
jgi:phosphatidylserine decarboxylase